MYAYPNSSGTSVTFWWHRLISRFASIRTTFCKYPINVLQRIQNSIKDYTCNIYINLWSLDRSDNRSDQSIKLQNANHEGLSSLLRYYRTTWVRDTAYLPRLKVFVAVILAMGDTYHPSYLYHKTTPKLVHQIAKHYHEGQLFFAPIIRKYTC